MVASVTPLKRLTVVTTIACSDFFASPVGAAHPFFAAVGNLFESSPYACAFVTCGVKASLADLVARSHGEKDERERERRSVVVKRGAATTKRGLNAIKGGDRGPSLVRSSSRRRRQHLGFVVYGALYSGVAQEFIYNSVFPALFGRGSDVGSVLTKVVFDQAVVLPLICLPVMYGIKCFTLGISLGEAASLYAYDLREHDLLRKAWRLWIPVKLIKFSVVPEHLRISFLAAVSFFWMILLSANSS